MKISISSELVQVQERTQKNLHTAKLPYGELILRRNFRTAKYLYVEISYSEISLRRNFLTVKFNYGEISLKRNFLRQNFPRRNFLRRNFRSRIVPYGTVEAKGVALQHLHHEDADSCASFAAHQKIVLILFSFFSHNRLISSPLTA